MRSIVMLLATVISVACYSQMRIAPTTFLQQLDSVAKLNSRPCHRTSNRTPSFFQTNNTNARRFTIGNNSVPSVNKVFGNTGCNDTSGRFSIGLDPGQFFVQDVIKAHDGNLLLCGEYYNYYDPVSQDKGYLMKCDLYGNVIWTKFYDSLNKSNPINYLVYSRILELKDGSILLSGGAQDGASANNDLILTRTDALGNMIWSKDVYSRIWGKGSGSNDYFYVQQMRQDPFSDDVYLTGPSWAQGLNLIKLDINSGTIPWSAMYKLQANGYNNEDVSGIVIKANEVVVIGSQSLYNSHLLIYSINKSTGDTLQTKMLQLLDTPFQKMGVYSNYTLQLLTNGDIALSFRQFGQYPYAFLTPAPLYQGGVIILNNNLDFKKGYSFRNSIESNIANSQITIHPDGSGLFTMLNRQGGYSGETYLTQFKDGVILKQRVRLFSNEGYPKENETIQFDNSADLMVQTVGDSINNKTIIVFTKLHLTDTASACLGRETNATFIEPLHFGYEGYAYLDSIRTSIFLPRRQRTLFQADISLAKPTFLCNQTSVCDTFKLLSNTDTTCPQIPILISYRKNPLCGSTVQFNYDTTAVQSFSWMNDSTYQVVFRTGWRGYLKGSLPGCTIHTDSVLLTILQAPASLNIGPDTSICPGNLLVLNAHTGYASYRWQNGSTDSSFTVTSPGIYFVKVKNACGDFFNDTVIVTAHAQIALSLGNDTTICNNETVTITAPSGFINYQWSPAYNISRTNGSSVNVSPAMDTYYNVKAEKSPGCFAYDTIKINVKIPPQIQLGPDKSFCSGDSVLLNAGYAFAQYQWSNGNVIQQIYVSTKGNYSVIGITADGCKSYDTLNILNVWPNPLVHLDQNPNLCIGSKRTLQPGNYSSYIWQNGSVLPSFTIRALGNYYVTVTDNHQCRGSDTVRIVSMHSTPSKFLPSDTAVCAYGKLILVTNEAFTSYLWSNGETSASISITQPGLYWMQATDQYSCTGKDSVTVLSKECVVGLYVPTAFSPNKDGKNDVFKPLIIGNIIQFEWSIYNRYGQIIFTTHDPAKGWDGTVNGVLQNAAGFVWQCRYQLEGEKMKFKSGYVVLVR